MPEDINQIKLDNEHLNTKKTDLITTIKIIDESEKGIKTEAERIVIEGNDDGTLGVYFYSRDISDNGRKIDKYVLVLKYFQ